MAKGLKMYQAKDKHVGGLIKIENIDPDNHGDFVCEDCEVDIKYTRAHTMHASGKEVSAYLSLKANIEHKDSCKYNVISAIKKVVDLSQSVEEGDPAIHSEDDGTYVFRLNFLERALLQTAYTSKEDRADNKHETVDNSAKKGIEYVLSNEQIASYFRSAKGVAKIKSLIEDKNDESNFKNSVKIKYKKKNIIWDDFYFEKENYKRLYDGQYEYPVAVKVFIKDNKIFENKEAKSFKYSIRCVALKTVEKEKIIIFSLFVAFNDLALARQISLQTHYILLGKILCSEMKKDKIEEHFYKSMNINIFNNNQIQKLDE